MSQSTYHRYEYIPNYTPYLILIYTVPYHILTTLLYSFMPIHIIILAVTLNTNTIITQSSSHLNLNIILCMSLWILITLYPLTQYISWTYSPNWVILFCNIQPLSNSLFIIIIIIIIISIWDLFINKHIYFQIYFTLFSLL